MVEDYLDGKLHVFDKDWPELPFAHREHIGCTVDYVAGRNRYMGYLISLGIYSFKGVKVGLDCANGASWNIAKSVFDALGADTYVINNKPNGTNINNNAGSTHIEGLQKFVVEKGLDVGFAYDGDADRCLCVDEKGNVITGDHILYLVQTLYEKKLLTYPRTDSQFIMDDMEDTARQVISIVCRQLPLFSGVSITPDIARVTDNSKVTDHHAILPTVQLEKQDVFALPQSEQKILNLVGMRLLCATGEKHTYAETQISLSCEGYEFKTKGKTVVQNGWKSIEELFKASLKAKEKDDPVKSLPEVHEGDVLDSVSASVTEHFTTPPKQYTDVICYERGIRNRP